MDSGAEGHDYITAQRLDAPQGGVACSVPAVKPKGFAALVRVDETDAGRS